MLWQKGDKSEIELYNGWAAALEWLPKLPITHWRRWTVKGAMAERAETDTALYNGYSAAP